ncbi:MAG: ribonuclease D [Alphaproteobacteria bacterium]
MNVIENTAELASVCDGLSNTPFVTVDTEFLRTDTYWPKLCLIQIGGPDDAWIVDPLAKGISLKPFAELLANENVLKVLHSARQDMEIFHHDLNTLPTPLFDTQLAAMVCGFGDSVGYDTLVQHFTKSKVDKASRFADWSRRPLSKKQLNYAIGDVTHLRDVYAALAAILEENGRASWLKEEMAVLTAPSTYAMEPEKMWERLKTRSTNRRFLGRVQAIAAWRERRAQEVDIPRNRVIRDDALLEIAAHPPKDQAELGRMRGVSDGLAKGPQGKAILKALEEGDSRPEAELPEPKAPARLPRGIGPTVDLLKVMLKMRCEDEKVAQKLVANVADLEALAADDDADVRITKGWRHEMFGKDALALKNGKLALSMKHGKVVIRKV